MIFSYAQDSCVRYRELDPSSVLPGWDGTSTRVVVRIDDGVMAGYDGLTVWNLANTAKLRLGSVNLGGYDYVRSDVTFGATGTPSTMVLTVGRGQGCDQDRITVTLGTPSADTETAKGPGMVEWTPDRRVRSRAGDPAFVVVDDLVGGDYKRVF